jgi:hypothetical protein
MAIGATVFRPEEFLELSHQLLAGDSFEEARYRTIASRSLYAIFLIAREELDKRGCKVKAVSPDYFYQEHNSVRNEFKVGGKFRHDRVSNRLDGLYRLRWHADYRLKERFTNRSAQQALEYADYILWVFSEKLFREPLSGDSTSLEAQPPNS